jgi:hypothetical protein
MASQEGFASWQPPPKQGLYDPSLERKDDNSNLYLSYLMAGCFVLYCFSFCLTKIRLYRTVYLF